ncbi:MAG: aminopeptidase P family protein, partial [Anaerolineales bacterium]|nr:aminopeptidase P family protein [Anaerolineales bacterium]
EIFRQFKIDVLGRGADDVAYLVGGAGRGGYEDIISPPSDYVTKAGDVLMLDTGALFDGYFCDFDRNFSFGPPTAEVQRAHETLYQATEAGLQTARAGITAADLFESMWRVLEKAGASASTTGRMGHGLGMQLTEWPSLIPTDQTILRTGMVITLEPALEVGRGRFLVHEEDLVIRESGAELLTKRASQTLPVIEP